MWVNPRHGRGPRARLPRVQSAGPPKYTDYCIMEYLGLILILKNTIFPQLKKGKPAPRARTMGQVTAHAKRGTAKIY